MPSLNQLQTYCSMHPSNRHTHSFAFPWVKKTKKVLLWLRKPTFTTLFLPDTNSHTNTSVAHRCFSYPHLLRHTKTQTTVIKIKSYIHERLFFADRSRDRTVKARPYWGETILHPLYDVYRWEGKCRSHAVCCDVSVQWRIQNCAFTSWSPGNLRLGGCHHL